MRHSSSACGLTTTAAISGVLQAFAARQIQYSRWTEAILWKEPRRMNLKTAFPGLRRPRNTPRAPP